MLVTALDGTADAVDALVGLLGGEALEGDLGGVVLLLEEVVIPASIEGPGQRQFSQNLINAVDSGRPN